jgi:hypothetical protein
MIKYNITVQGIHFKTLESSGGYNLNLIGEEVNKAVNENLIAGVDKTKPLDVKVTRVY